MNKSETVVVVGLGEVGKPLYQLVSKYHKVIGVDVAPLTTEVKQVDVLHVCFPFQINDFVGEAVRYIDLFEPGLTVVNSTVAVGTTRAIAQRAGTGVIYSPVRGKHAHMLEDLQRYTKFVGGLDRPTSERGTKHFASMGLKTKIMSSPEVAEIAKLTETTFFGLMIAWAQEVERYADHLGVKYDEIVPFYEEIGFFPPVKYFPGIIGGHCVMPNIELLSRLEKSEILAAIESSNQMKIEREAVRTQPDEAKSPRSARGRR
jgi:UDP-N-acetyl-D-mannosaminuronate dehydrogenase